MSTQVWTRRQLLLRSSAALGAVLVAGCDRLSAAPSFQRLLGSAEGLNYRVQRLLIGQSLAREFAPDQVSPIFRSNGTSNPDNPTYNGLLQNGFADWRLDVGGLVRQPLQLSLAALRALPARRQITRHDCVEGWSAIGKWTGVPLGHVLNMAQLAPEARFVVLHCADELERNDGGYYESIDLVDAFHPQTLLAYELNDRPLSVANGAPLRLRVERQLGYKHAKYLMRIEAVADFQRIGLGKGGYWEDRGYMWYAGI
jgi:DMSO/TMAO reductase YedYZ molybdopterin-dependent catalytic subunit